MDKEQTVFKMDKEQTVFTIEKRWDAEKESEQMLVANISSTPCDSKTEA